LKQQQQQPTTTTTITNQIKTVLVPLGMKNNLHQKSNQRQQHEFIQTPYHL